MKIVVTGGTGFRGSHLARRLLLDGHDVVVLDNQPGLFAGELSELGARVEIGSITDAPLLDRLMEGVDTVHHLAAAFRQINVPKKVYWEVNVEGTRNVLEAARRCSVRRVVYCSTQGVHGHREEPARG